MRKPIALALVALLACAACGRDGERAGTAGVEGEDAALPAPARNDGSVTGMPGARGPGDVPIAGEPPPPPPDLLPMDQFGMPSAGDNPEAGLGDGGGDAPADAAGEPTIADAEAVIDAYYAAITSGDLPAAYRLWSDDGRASGQTAEQFAAGFADTAASAVSRGQAGTVEGAAGSRFVEIPVSVTATRRDGGSQRYLGRYVLRRAMVDGADTTQRAWRIESAELRPVE